MTETTDSLDLELLDAQIVVDAHQDGPMPCCHDATHCRTLWYALRLVKDRLGKTFYLDPPKPPPLPHVPAPRPPTDRAPTPKHASGRGEFACGLLIGATAGVLSAVVVVGAALSTVLPY